MLLTFLSIQDLILTVTQLLYFSLEAISKRNMIVKSDIKYFLKQTSRIKRIP